MPEGQKPPAQETESLEEIQRRYAESSTEGKRLAARVKQLEDENRALALRQQPAPPDPDEAALEEAGIDTSVLKRFVARESSANVRQELRPVFIAGQALQGVPMELQPKAQALLASNPDVADAYNALLAAEKPESAAKILVQSVRMHDAEAGMNQENDAAKAKRERERQDAAIPAGHTGRGTTENADAEQAAERRSKLREHAQAVGGFNKAIASEFLKGRIKVIERLDEPPRVI